MTVPEPTDGAGNLRALLTTDSARGRVRAAHLPAALRERYGSDLSIALVDGRPTVIANFVTTLDGVVAFDPDAGLGGGSVSGHFEPDRFVMGLLRSVADAVLVGAGTVRSDGHGRWVAASVHPATAKDTARVRADLGLAPTPTTVVVTTGGELDLAHPGLSDPSIPVIIATTERGRSRLERAKLPANAEIVVAGDERVDVRTLIDVLDKRDVELVLCEGGPHLIGELIGAHSIDELFLTIAPQLAGRADGVNRLALVEDRAFSVADAPWATLVDLRINGDHLFSRYRFGGER